MFRITLALFLAVVLTLVGYQALVGEVQLAGTARELLMGIAPFLMMFALNQVVPSRKTETVKQG